MKKGQRARRLEVPYGTDHSTNRSGSRGAARARRAQGQRRRRSLGGWLPGWLSGFRRAGPERATISRRDSKVNEQVKKKTYSSMAKYFLRFNKRQGRSLPPKASFLLRRASKSTRNRPKRSAQGSASGAEEASR